MSDAVETCWPQREDAVVDCSETAGGVCTNGCFLIRTHSARYWHRMDDRLCVTHPCRWHSVRSLFPKCIIAKFHLSLIHVLEERRPLSVYIRFPRVIHCHCVKVFYIACQSTLKWN